MPKNKSIKSKNDKQLMRAFLRGVKLQTYYRGSCDNMWRKVKTADQLIEALQCKNTLVREKPEAEYWHICRLCGRAFDWNYEFLDRNNAHPSVAGGVKKCANAYPLLVVKVVGDSSLTDTWTPPSFSGADE